MSFWHTFSRYPCVVSPRFRGPGWHVKTFFTMPQSLKTVAVLVANPALSSILSMTLAGVTTLRVRPFETQVALTTYLRLAPADLVVVDFDSTIAHAGKLAEAIRDHGFQDGRRLQIIALAGTVTPEIRDAAAAAGIDEVIVKPMSPRYLVERVMARLLRVPARPVTPSRRRSTMPDWSRFGDNVVPLFGRDAQPDPRAT